MMTEIQLQRGREAIHTQAIAEAKRRGVTLRVQWLPPYRQANGEVHTLKFVGIRATYQIQLDRQWIEEHADRAVDKVNHAISTGIAAAG